MLGLCRVSARKDGLCNLQGETLISVKLTTRYDSEPCPTVLDINRECPYFLAFSGFAVYGKDFLKFWV